MIALLLAAALLAPPSTNLEQLAGNGCIAHGSETTPPASIRVRTDYHHVVKVPFQLWVSRVTSSEWGSTPTELRKAGAVAVKGYGWWKSLHPRRSPAGCFDLWGNTRDAIYRQAKIPPDYVWSAVRATWSWRVIRDGRLVHTGWRTGAKVGCARDVDSWHLFARSARRCALAGWSARRILSVYYAAKVVR